VLQPVYATLLNLRRVFRQSPGGITVLGFVGGNKRPLALKGAAAEDAHSAELHALQKQMHFIVGEQLLGHQDAYTVSPRGCSLTSLQQPKVAGRGALSFSLCCTRATTRVTPIVPAHCALHAR
jgi:hypothetical protein